jgi:hypothetical protein
LPNGGRRAAALLVYRPSRSGCPPSLALGLLPLPVGKLALLAGEPLCPLGGSDPADIPHFGCMGALKVGGLLVQIGSAFVRLGCAHMMVRAALRAIGGVHQPFPGPVPQW